MTAGTPVYCRVTVEAYSDTVVAYVVGAGGCSLPLARAPRCKLTDLWQRAIADGVDARSVGQITYRPTGWSFTDAADKTHSSKDDC